jgi:hypothetical protein
MIRSWLQRVQHTRAQNTGSEIGSWSPRMQAAWTLFRKLVPEDAPPREVADFGCGRQELRALLPTGWSYVPYDWISRSPDTRVCDLTQTLPEARHEVIFMLGVLEYMPDPARLLRHALTHAHWTVFSCFHGWNPLRAWREGWRGRLTREQVEEVIRQAGASLRVRSDWRGDGAFWICEKKGGTP